MKAIKRVETLMLQRKKGWWDEICMVIPSLKKLEGIPQPPEYHAEGDVAVHTIRAVEACPEGCDPDLFWCALLHDIGKLETTICQEDGRITSHGHAKRGAGLAEKILVQLGMPSERCNRIVWVIHHHMFNHSWQLQSPGDLTNRQRAFLLDPRFPLLLEFLRIDALASQGKTNGLQVFEFYKRLWKGQLDMETERTT